MEKDIPGYFSTPEGQADASAAFALNANNGMIDYMKYMIEHLTIDIDRPVKLMTSGFVAPPLIHAILNYKKEAAYYLIDEAGADVKDAKGIWGHSTIHWAMERRMFDLSNILSGRKGLIHGRNLQQAIPPFVALGGQRMRPSSNSSLTDAAVM